jgi:hypothetical protein
LTPLIVAFRDLIQFRLGPQDLPYAPRLLGAVVLALIVSSLMLVRVLPDNRVPSPLAILLEPMFVLGALYALLSLKQFGNRLVQTALGWMGAELIFLILQLPFLFAIGKLPTKQEEITPQYLVLVWPLLAVVVWKVAVQAHVLRHALQTKWVAAVLTTLAVNVVTTVLFGMTAE